MKVAAKRTWVTTLLMYTLSGAFASIVAGMALGFLGQLILWERMLVVGHVVIVALGLLVVAREMGWIAVALPQPKRQTREIWGKTMRRPIAALFWGFDLGLIFTTWFTFAGTWLIVGLAVISGNPMVGAALFVAYWLGRALSIWIFPFAMKDANDTPLLLDGINAEHRTLQRVHVAATIVLVAAVVLSSDFELLALE